jgi:hypothetical protein
MPWDERSEDGPPFIRLRKKSGEPLVWVHASKSQTTLLAATSALHLLQGRMKNRRGSIMSIRRQQSWNQKKRNKQKQTGPKSSPPFA